MELTFSPVQTLIVAIIATLLASLLAWVVEKAVPWFIGKVWKKPVKVDLGRFVKSLLVICVALALAGWWYPLSLPALPNFAGTAWDKIAQFFGWLPILAAALSPYFGMAAAIYNLLLGYITDPDRSKKLFALLRSWLFPHGDPFPF